MKRHFFSRFWYRCHASASEPHELRSIPTIIKKDRGKKALHMNREELAPVLGRDE